MGSQNLRILPFARFQAIRAGSAGHFLPAFGSFSTFSSQPLLLAPASLIWLRSSEWTKGGNFNVLPVRPIAPLSIQLGQPNAGKAFAQMREKLACQSTRSLQLFIDNDLVKEADQSYSVLQCITKQYQAVPSIQGNSQVPDPSIPKQTCHNILGEVVHILVTYKTLEDESVPGQSGGALLSSAPQKCWSIAVSPKAKINGNGASLEQNLG